MHGDGNGAVSDGGAHNGPKMAQNNQKWASTRRAPVGFSVPVHGQNSVRQRVGCLLVMFGSIFARQMVSVVPIWARLGPACIPQSDGVEFG